MKKQGTDDLENRLAIFGDKNRTLLFVRVMFLFILLYLQFIGIDDRAARLLPFGEAFLIFGVGINHTVVEFFIDYHDSHTEHSSASITFEAFH